MAALRPIFIVICYLQHAAVSTPLSPSNPILPIQSLNTPTPPMMSNICVCNYINCFTHIAWLFRWRRQKRAAGQATELSLTAVRLGRTHRPASNPLSPSSGAPTWPAWVPPGPPRYHPSRPALAVPKGKHIHGRRSIYVGFFKDRNTIIISLTRVISNLFNIRFSNF